jgi:hypothetical protein
MQLGITDCQRENDSLLLKLVTETSSMSYANGQCRENRLRLKHGRQHVSGEQPIGVPGRQLSPAGGAGRRWGGVD